MAITHEFYEDNTLTAGYQLWGINLTNVCGTTFTTNDGYLFLQNPNVWPDHASPGVKGIALSSPPPGNVYPTNSYPWAEIPLAGSGSTVRWFFKKIQLRLRWKDRESPINYQVIPGRWVGGGGEEYDWYRWRTLPGERRLQSWAGGTPYWEGGSDAPGSHEYGLTDASGICEYIMLAGIAVSDPAVSAGAWQLTSPPVSGGRAKQNITLYTNDKETHWRVPFRDTEPAYQYAVRDARTFRQCVAGGNSDGGHGLFIDYTTDWNAGSGMLTVPAPVMPIDFAYEQTLTLEIPDHDSGTTATFGPYTADLSSGSATVFALPRGSVLKDVREGPSGSQEITSLPLQDASAYPSSVGVASQGKPHLVPPAKNLLSVSGPPYTVAESGIPHLETTYTGKVSNSLSGVKVQDSVAGWDEPQNGMYFGGEVLTLPYEVTITHGDGSSRTELRYVYEDSATEVVSTDFGTGQYDDLDYAMDPYGEPYLTERRTSDVYAWGSADMEQTWAFHKVLSGVELQSPSRAILPEGRHCLAGIVGGECRIYRSDDAESFTTLAHAAFGSSYVAVKQCLDPDRATLHLWIVGAGEYNQDYSSAFAIANGILHSYSTDGGETWTAPVGVASLPATRPERGDVLHDGLQWLRSHPKASGDIHLFGSPDGEVWSDLGAIATGNNPRLALLPDGSLCCAYTVNGAFKAKVGTLEASGYTWGAAVHIDGLSRGHAIYANGQKILASFRKDAADILHKRALDQETYSDGGEG